MKFYPLILFCLIVSKCFSQEYLLEEKTHKFDTSTLSFDKIDTTIVIDTIFNQTSNEVEFAKVDSLKLYLLKTKNLEPNQSISSCHLIIQDYFGNELLFLKNWYDFNSNINISLLKTGNSDSPKLLFLETKIGIKPERVFTKIILIQKNKVFDLGALPITLENKKGNRMELLGNSTILYHPMSNKITLEFKAPRIKYAWHYSSNIDISNITSYTCEISRLFADYNNTYSWEMHSTY